MVKNIASSEIPTRCYGCAQEKPEGRIELTISGELIFLCFDCLLNDIKQKKRTLSYGIAWIEDNSINPIEQNFTQKLRDVFSIFRDKKIEFIVKYENKVRGRYKGIFHKPETGFFVELTNVVYNADYFGGLRLTFPLKDVTWSQSSPFARLRKVITEDLPMLESAKIREKLR